LEAKFFDLRVQGGWLHGENFRRAAVTGDFPAALMENTLNILPIPQFHFRFCKESRSITDNHL
jgi:hypothetical protein